MMNRNTTRVFCAYYFGISWTMLQLHGCCSGFRILSSYLQLIYANATMYTHA